MTAETVPAQVGALTIAAAIPEYRCVLVTAVTSARVNSLTAFAGSRVAISDVGDDREAQPDADARAQSLQGTEGDQLIHRLRGAAGDRADVELPQRDGDGGMPRQGAGQAPNQGLFEDAELGIQSYRDDVDGR